MILMKSYNWKYHIIGGSSVETKGRVIEEVNQYIENLPENIKLITENLRQIILDSSPKLVEEYKWSMPNYSYKGLVCYLQSSKNM